MLTLPFRRVRIAPIKIFRERSCQGIMSVFSIVNAIIINIILVLGLIILVRVICHVNNDGVFAVENEPWS